MEGVSGFEFWFAFLLFNIFIYKLYWAYHEKRKVYYYTNLVHDWIRNKWDL